LVVLVVVMEEVVWELRGERLRGEGAGRAAVRVVKRAKVRVVSCILVVVFLRGK
jgi:hypothetical protein